MEKLIRVATTAILSGKPWREMALIYSIDLTAAYGIHLQPGASSCSVALSAKTNGLQFGRILSTSSGIQG